MVSLSEPDGNAAWCLVLMVSNQRYYDSRALCSKGNHDCYDYEYGI